MKLRVIFSLVVLLLPLLHGCLPKSNLEVSAPLSAPTRIATDWGASVMIPAGWVTVSGSIGKNAFMAVTTKQSKWQAFALFGPAQTPEYLPPQEELQKMSAAQKAELLEKYDREQEKVYASYTTIVPGRSELREINGLYGIVSNDVRKGPKDKAPVRNVMLTVRVGDRTAFVSVNCLEAHDPELEREAENIVNSFEFKAPGGQP